MARFAFSGPLAVPFILLVPTYSTSLGVRVKTFPEVSKAKESDKFFGTFRTFGGTEVNVNGAFSVEDTGTIETWYRPDIASDCRVYNTQDGTMYEVIGTPENIEGRNQYLKIKVKAFKGGA